MKCHINKTDRGIQVLSEVMEGPHEKDRCEGDDTLSKMLNVLPRQRVICTVHGTDADAERWADTIVDALTFEEPY